MKNGELLTRIDERTLNIWRVLEKLEAHQKEANGYIQENMKRTIKNSTWIMAFRWVIGLLVVVIGACITGYLGVW